MLIRFSINFSEWYTIKRRTVKTTWIEKSISTIILYSAIFLVSSYKSLEAVGETRSGLPRKTSTQEQRRPGKEKTNKLHKKHEVSFLGIKLESSEIRKKQGGASIP